MGIGVLNTATLHGTCTEPVRSTSCQHRIHERGDGAGTLRLLLASKRMSGVQQIEFVFLVSTVLRLCS